MYPAPFTYTKPRNLDLALEQLGQEDAVAIAGGQSLSAYLKHRVTRPDIVVDLDGIPELRGVTVEDGWVRIGAMTTWAELNVNESRLIPDAIAQAAGEVGDVQVRNRGTIAGGIVLANPDGDIHAAVTGTGLEVEIVGTAGRRREPIAEFYLGPFITNLDEGELVTAIYVPPSLQQSIYLPGSPRAADYVVSAVGASMHERNDGRSFRVAVTGLPSRPIVVEDPDPAAVIEQAQQEVRDVEARSTADFPGSYRRQVALRLLESAQQTIDAWNEGDTP